MFHNRGNDYQSAPQEGFMEYIIFLVTIQLPFVYMIWRWFQKYRFENLKALRESKERMDHVASFMDTLRVSVEKISEDIYGKGQVSTRMFNIEKEVKELKKHFHHIEVYTGLGDGTNPLDELSSRTGLKEKSFR